MNAGQQHVSVVVRLSFGPPDLRVGLDELRDRLQRVDSLQRRVSVQHVPDGQESLGLQEVVDVVVGAATSNLGSNVVGGILGGVLESVLSNWIRERRERAGRPQARTSAPSEEQTRPEQRRDLDPDQGPDRGQGLHQTQGQDAQPQQEPVQDGAAPLERPPAPRRPSQAESTSSSEPERTPDGGRGGDRPERREDAGTPPSVDVDAHVRVLRLAGADARVELLIGDDPVVNRAVLAHAAKLIEELMPADEPQGRLPDA